MTCAKQNMWCYLNIQILWIARMECCTELALWKNQQLHTQSVPAVFGLQGVDTFSPNLDCTMICVAFSAKNLVNLSKSFLSCRLSFWAILTHTLPAHNHIWHISGGFSGGNNAFLPERTDINIRPTANQKATQRDVSATPQMQETCVTSRIY